MHRTARETQRPAELQFSRSQILKAVFPDRSEHIPETNSTGKQA